MLSDGEAPTRLPETLHGLVTARVDGLAPVEKALLQDASVLGKVFWTDALVALLVSTQSISRSGCVPSSGASSSAASDARPSRAHASTRSCTHSSVTRPTARSRVLPAPPSIVRPPSGSPGCPPTALGDRAETLAHHLEAAIGYGTAAGIDVTDITADAVQALREAGDRAVSLNVLGRAERYYRRALELGGDSKADPELLYLAAQAQYWSAGSSAVDDAAFEQAIDALVEAGKTELAAVGCVVLARARWEQQILPTELFARAEALVRDLPASAARAEVLSTVGAYVAINGDSERGLALAEQAVADARAVGDVEIEAHALNSLGVAQDVACRYNDAIASTSKALELALEVGSNDASRCLINLASFEFGLGLLEDSNARFRDVLVLARRSEAKMVEDWVVRENAISAYYLGRWQEALEGIDTFGALLADDAHIMDIPLAFAHVAIIHERDGVVLEDELTWGVERARVIGDPQVIQPMLAESALVLARAGRHQEARALLNELTGIAVGPRAMFLGSALSAALAWAAIGGTLPRELTLGPGRWDDAARLVRDGDLTAAADLLAEMGARGHEAWARILAAQLLSRSEPDEARAQLDHATEFLRDTPAPAALARAERVAADLRSAAS